MEDFEHQKFHGKNQPNIQTESLEFQQKFVKKAFLCNEPQLDRLQSQLTS